MDRVKVLYVAGAGRSGSTILHNILGQIDNYVAVGEVRYIWERGLIKNRLCGCGVPLRHCPFWQNVMEEALGGIDRIEAQKLFDYTESFRTRHLPLTCIPRLRARRIRQMCDYLACLEKLYQAIQRVTQCDVIVDSSKNAAYGYLLSKLLNIDLYVVHCVRDPRAVSFSWLKKGMLFQPGIDDPDYMERKSILKSTLHWNAWNLFADLFVKPNARKSMTIRYETLVARPRDTIRLITEMMSSTTASLPFSDAHTVTIQRPNHSVFGNPVRFQTGEVLIKLDDEWRRCLGNWDRVKVTALTAPLIPYYGYSLRS